MIIKWLFRLSVVFNLLVIGSAIAVWQKPMLVFGPLLEGIRANRIDMFENFPVLSNDIVFLGDSITEGGYWNEMFPGLSVKNRGIGGDTTTNVLDRLQQVIAGSPKVVFLKIGTNDLTHGPEERADSYRQYEEILQRISAASPSTQIYTQSILPRGIEYREEVEAFNQEIQRLSIKYEAQYIDLYPGFLGNDGTIKDELTYDELHLNGLGYRHWQSLLQPYLIKPGMSQSPAE